MRNRTLLQAAIPATLAAVALALGTFAACGGDDDDLDSTPVATVEAVGDKIDRTTAPKLDTPASKYSLLLDDVGITAYLTDIPSTAELTQKSYSTTEAFNSPQEGERLLSKWGHLGGYQTALIPEGRNQTILLGGYVIYVESHILNDVDGAKGMYAYLVDRIRANNGQAVNAGPVGNESSAWRVVSGTVQGSTIPQAYHRMVFRRGNLVVIVLTIGADPFMKVETVRSLALLVDEKALGKKEAVEPTPTSNFTPPADRVKTATAVTASPTPRATPTAAR